MHDRVHATMQLTDGVHDVVHSPTVADVGLEVVNARRAGRPQR